METSPITLAFRGNIVFATRNPFAENATDDAHYHNGNDTQWLGPGLLLCLDHVLTVNQMGFIVDLFPAHKFDWNAVKSEVQVQTLPPHSFLVPGLIDLHIHAPQFAYTGTATDRPLMGPDGWLETYTFPAEASLADNAQLCQQVYQGVVQTTLAMGTTTAVYFATLHAKPCQTLVDIVQAHGQRALIGKVCMDRYSPANYCQSLDQNLKEAEQVIQYILDTVGRRVDVGDNADDNTLSSSSAPLPRILPLVTPRFIPTCTPALLTALGQLAAKYNCHITSHISESVDEVAFSRHLDVTEDNIGENRNVGRTDAVIFDSHGLLTNQCIMAHGVFLSDSDLDLLRTRQSAVAHCPLSNFFFAGGCLLCRHLMQRGNRVGLGTDVAGGYSPSMWNASRLTVIASRALQHQQQTNEDNKNDERSSGGDTDKKVAAQLDYRHAFYLATLGGAEALSLAHRIGTFRPGMEFDAVVLGVESPLQVFELDSVADVFQKLCVLGDDRHVKSVYVQGRKVK